MCLACVFIALWYDKSRQIIFYFWKFCTYCLCTSDMRWSRVTFDVNSIDAKFDWDCVKSALSKINYFHILLLRRINLEKIFQIVKTGNIYLPLFSRQRVLHKTWSRATFYVKFIEREICLTLMRRIFLILRQIEKIYIAFPRW